VSEDVRPATVMASASTTTTEREFNPVNPGNDIVVRSQVAPNGSVSVPAFKWYLNQYTQDFYYLNH
jgi:hypothetical protein